MQTEICNTGSTDTKLALFFPGLGYNCDKPLLYYAKKTAAKLGYEILEVKYGTLPSGKRGDSVWLDRCISEAVQQTDTHICAELPRIKSSGTITCIAKSIGTAIAARWCAKHGLSARFVAYTPLEQTFSSANRTMVKPLVFTGTADPWFPEEQKQKFPWPKDSETHVFPGANHSLETGDIDKDIQNLREIINITESYLSVF